MPDYVGNRFEDGQRMSSPSIAIDPVPAKDRSAVHSNSAELSERRHVDDSAFLQQIERILQSKELSGSELLPRLLRYLAEKTISGEADELKEYTVAIDGLGKPASYDPRHTSAVRIQAGRLRQKLIDYYHSEGADDLVVISLPKGHFRLSFRYRASGLRHAEEGHELLSSVVAEEVPARRTAHFWLSHRPLLWIALASIVLNVYLWLRSPRQVHVSDVASLAESTPAMRELWTPFINSKRPLMLVLEDPLFVEFHSGSGIYYRDKTSGNTWDDALKTAGLNQLRKALNNPAIEPSHYYTSFGEAHAAFVVGRLFGNSNQNFFSVARASQVVPADLASNNILIVGIPTRIFEDQLKQMPVQAELQYVPEGIRDLHPAAGQPSLYPDRFSTAPTEEGVAYALVSHLPGPRRNTDVESFVGHRSTAYGAAVDAFSDPDFAADVVSKLKLEGGGRMPRYFQAVLKVTFKNSVPTETTCVLVRELR